MNFFKKARKQSWFTSPITIGYMDAIQNLKAVEKIISKYDKELISKILFDSEDWQYYSIIFTKNFQTRLQKLLINLHNNYDSTTKATSKISQSISSSRYLNDSVSIIAASIINRINMYNRKDVLNILNELDTTPVLKSIIILNK